MIAPMNKADIPKAGSPLEAELALQFRLNNITPEREYRFELSRKWRFDFAWPKLLFAVEVEGITYDGGRHQRVDGFEKDLEKYQAAMLSGWTVYRVSRALIKDLRALATVQLMLARYTERDQAMQLVLSNLSDGNTSKNTGIL